MRVLVTLPWTTHYPAPISFGAGETVIVKHEDTEFPGWFRCVAPAGIEGWVHRSFLKETTGATVGLRAYTAAELTVTGGETGECLQNLDGWLWLQLDDGREGWLPAAHCSTMH